MLDKDQRNVIVENFQSLLRPIRNIMDCSIAEMAEAIGVTRQTMNNLETRKTGMSQTQYIALAAFIDHYFRQNGRLLPAVQTIIDQEGTKNAADYDTSFRDGSLIERWFEGMHACAEDMETADDDGFTEELGIIARQYRIFMDTNILMTENAGNVVDDLVDALRTAERSVIVPLRLVEELRTQRGNPAAQTAIKYLKQMQTQGVLDIRGEAGDPDFADIILSVFTRFRSAHRLCLLTNNRELAREVLRLNETGLEKENNPIVVGWVRDGRLHSYAEQPIAVESKEQELLLDTSGLAGWEEMEEEVSKDTYVPDAEAVRMIEPPCAPPDTLYDTKARALPHTTIPNGWGEV